MPKLIKRVFGSKVNSREYHYEDSYYVKAIARQIKNGKLLIKDIYNKKLKTAVKKLLKNL